MWRRTATAFFTTIFLCFSSNILARTDILPSNLIALSSPLGNQLFIRSYSPDYFWPLNLNFVTQENLTYCSIASSVIVLNALGINSSPDPKYYPFKMMSQESFFNANVQKVLPPALVEKQGATLDQIGAALSLYPLSLKVVHANEMTEGQFRSIAEKIIENKKGYIIVNFLRTSLGEHGEGHMSPLAAYDQKTDRFLMLDVARYRYPPVWVKTNELWKAMDTKDESGSQAYRGFIILFKK